MKKNRTLLFLLFFIAFYASQPVFAQNPRKIISQADKAFFNDDWKAALELYKKALALQPNNLKINYRLGYLLMEQQQPGQAIPYLEKANKLSLKFSPENANLLAEAYQFELKFDQAYTQYQLILSKTKKKEEAEVARLKKRMEECKAGQELVAFQPAAEITNLGPTVNSLAADYSPILTNKDQSLLFTSGRKSAINKNQTAEDVYEARRTEAGWSAPIALPKPINNTGFDAATAISADGNTLYLYRENNSGDIYESKKSGSGWGKLKPMPDPINSKSFEPSFFIVQDNQFAFFASDREDGFGGLDLYLAMKQPDGTWSEALNLGGNINTEYDEDAPFVDANGTLYFSSRGHNSMGGYDIFSSTAQGAAWTQAQNLGYPVNTPYNDIYFSTTSGGHQAIFSSDRAGGIGEKDLYQAIFRSAVATDSLIATLPPPPDTLLSEASPGLPLVKQMATTVKLQGGVFDAGTSVPLIARLTFKEKSKQAPFLTVSTDSITGMYVARLEKGKTYNLEVRREGYFYFTEDINIAVAYQADSLVKNISLRKIQAGAKMVLKNIFFQSGKDVLTKSSRAELDRLYSLFIENPKLKVEISGHTDNKGKVTTNQLLSLKRAKAVVNYLAKRGIARSRMVAIGFGSRKPIASNRFEEGRKQNRRTEFKILSQ